MLAFLCLAAFKFFAVISSDGANASAALFYFAMFGSPQLVAMAFAQAPAESRPGQGGRVHRRGFSMHFLLLRLFPGHHSALLGRGRPI